jgi:hypothetical protein
MSPTTPRQTDPAAPPAQPVQLPAGTVVRPGQPAIVVQQSSPGVIGPAAPGATGAQPFDTHTAGRHESVSETEREAARRQELIVVSHSNFLYWWPVWVTGYVMALITWLHAQPVQLGDTLLRTWHSKRATPRVRSGLSFKPSPTVR